MPLIWERWTGGRHCPALLESQEDYTTQQPTRKQGTYSVYQFSQVQIVPNKDLPSKFRRRCGLHRHRRQLAHRLTGLALELGAQIDERRFSVSHRALPPLPRKLFRRKTINFGHAIFYFFQSHPGNNTGGRLLFQFFEDPFHEPPAPQDPCVGSLEVLSSNPLPLPRGST